MFLLCHDCSSKYAALPSPLFLFAVEADVGGSGIPQAGSVIEGLFFFDEDGTTWSAVVLGNQKHRGSWLTGPMSSMLRDCANGWERVS